MKRLAIIVAVLCAVIGISAVPECRTTTTQGSDPMALELTGVATHWVFVVPINTSMAVWTPPAGAYWKLMDWSLTYRANAGAGARQPVIQVNDPTAGVFMREIPMPYAPTLGQAAIYDPIASGAAAVNYNYAANKYIATVPFRPIWMVPGSTLSITDLNAINLGADTMDFDFTIEVWGAKGTSVAHVSIDTLPPVQTFGPSGT